MPLTDIDSFDLLKLMRHEKSKAYLVCLKSKLEVVHASERSNRNLACHITVLWSLVQIGDITVTSCIANGSQTN